MSFSPGKYNAATTRKCVRVLFPENMTNSTARNYFQTTMT